MYAPPAPPQVPFSAPAFVDAHDVSAAAQLCRAWLDPRVLNLLWFDGVQDRAGRWHALTCDVADHTGQTRRHQLAQMPPIRPGHCERCRGQLTVDGSAVDALARIASAKHVADTAEVKLSRTEAGPADLIGALGWLDRAAATLGSSLPEAARLVEQLTEELGRHLARIDGIQEQILEAVAALILRDRFGDAIDPDSIRHVRYLGFIAWVPSVERRQYWNDTPAETVSQLQRTIEEVRRSPDALLIIPRPPTTIGPFSAVDRYRLTVALRHLFDSYDLGDADAVRVPAAAARKLAVAGSVWMEAPCAATSCLNLEAVRLAGELTRVPQADDAYATALRLVA